MLATTLAGQLPGATIVVDPEPDSPIRSPWRTYRHALVRHLASSGASHLLILQDDVLLCRSFLPTVERVVAAKPDSVLTLFVAGQPSEHARALLRACSVDEPFAALPSRYWIPAVALVWPTPIVAAALEFVDRQGWPERLSADDEIIGRAMRALHETVWATVPSLVEHPDVVPSLVGRKKAMAGKNRGRVAACFIAEEIDPLTIEWRRP